MRSFPRILKGGSDAERAGRAVILASFLSGVGFTFVFPLLPLYVKELSDSGTATAFWSGLALAATPLGGAALAPFWGRLADRVGYRPMLLRALVTTTLLIGLMALPNAPWQLVLLRLLAGALGSFQPAAMGALTAWSRPEDLSRGISRLQMAQVFGTIVGPLLGGAVAALYGIRFAPVAGAATIAVGVILVARWFHEPARRRALPRGSEGPLRPTLLWLPMLTLAAVQFTESSFNPILPLILAQSEADAGRAATLAGLAISFSASAAAVASGLAGRSLKRGVGYRTMVVGALAVTLLALAALVAPLPWGLLAIRVLCGGAVAAMAVAAFSAGGMAVPPAQRGSAYGWLSSSSMGGFAASPIAAGALAAIDLRAVLALDVALCLATAAGWGWTRGISPWAERADAMAPAAEPSRHRSPAVAPAEGSDGA